MAVDTVKVIAIVGGVVALGAGAYFVLRTPPGHKKAGSTLTAQNIHFRYQGPKTQVWVGFGLAPKPLLGHGEVTVFFYEPVDVAGSETKILFSAPDLKTKVPALTPGIYDALLFIQTVNGELSTNAKFLVWRWKDKAITID